MDLREHCNHYIDNYRPYADTANNHLLARS